MIVGGEDVNVPRKNGLARTLQIRSPIAMAGNKFLDYKDSNGNVTRRVVALRYQRYLPAEEQDGAMETTIVTQELPAIIKRCNPLYLQQARANGNKSVWHLLPQYYVDIRHSAAETVNPLLGFLSTPCPAPHNTEPRHFVLYEEGATATQCDLVQALQGYMRHTHPGAKVPSRWSGDEVQPLYAKGYQRKQVAVCKVCRQQHKAGCCESYGSNNKTTETVWINLKLMTVAPTRIYEDVF